MQGEQDASGCSPTSHSCCAAIIGKRTPCAACRPSPAPHAGARHMTARRISAVLMAHSLRHLAASGREAAACAHTRPRQMHILKRQGVGVPRTDTRRAGRGLRKRSARARRMQGASARRAGSAASQRAAAWNAASSPLMHSASLASAPASASGPSRTKLGCAATWRAGAGVSAARPARRRHAPQQRLLQLGMAHWLRSLRLPDSQVFKAQACELRATSTQFICALTYVLHT